MPDLAEARRRLSRLRDPRGGPAPWPVRHAARLTRLLSELPTSTGDYDRVAPRHGGRTLRRLLDDLLDADPRNDFPASWHTRVAAEWGAVRASLSAAYDALAARNPLTSVIADLAEDAYRTGQSLDIVLRLAQRPGGPDSQARELRYAPHRGRTPGHHPEHEHSRRGRGAPDDAPGRPAGLPLGGKAHRS